MVDGRESEIEALANRLGPPLRWTRTYNASGPSKAAWVRRMTRRSGEVILATPDSSGRYIVHTKSTYPKGIYRLPGGGIDRGEGIEHAALREMAEEMGFDLQVERLLGVVENLFSVEGQEFSYPSFVFLTRPATSLPRNMDPNEAIAAFDAVPLNEFPRLIARLVALPADWQPWGEFRAAPHDLVLEQLLTGRPD